LELSHEIRNSGVKIRDEGVMAEYEFNVIVKEIPGGSLEDWSEKLFTAGGEFDLLPGVSNGIPDVDVV